MPRETGKPLKLNFIEIVSTASSCRHCIPEHAKTTKLSQLHVNLANDP